MFAVFIAIILGVIALAGIGYAVAARSSEKKRADQYAGSTWGWGLLVTAIAGFFGALVLFGSMYSPVGTSDVGVVTAFGHTEGDLTPGIHWIAPWKNVTIWDGSVQRTSFEGKDCLQVRLFGGQTACLPTVIQWQDVAAASDSQFRRYKTFLRLEAAYMSRGTLVGYFNNRFESFNPVQVASLQANGGATGGTNVSALVKKVANDLRTAYNGQINIERVTVGTPDYDAYIDGQLNKVVGAKAGLEVATINEKTALAEAAAAKNLAAGGHLTPLVVLNNCIDTARSLAQAGETTSPTWNCSGLFSGAANSSSFLITGK